MTSVQQPNETVVGWEATARHLSARAGFHIGVDRAMRFARRKQDPLPVRKFGKGLGRVVANTAELDRWCDAQWCEVGTARLVTPSQQGK